MPLKADYIMMFNAPWRVLKGEQCEALMKEGKIRYVNHLRKLSFINFDDSKHKQERRIFINKIETS